jgi:hypothetical protein
MAKIKVDVSGIGLRFKSAFGVVSVNQGKSLEKRNYKSKAGLQGVDVYEANDGSFEELVIKGAGFNLVFANMIDNDRFRLEDITAPPPMITFERAKRITATPIDDSDEDPTNNSEVVERYNSGKWNISIQGILVDMVNHQFPKAQLTLLNQLFEVNDILKVEGDWFDALNIKSIYMETFGVSGVSGYEDTVQFNISASSIVPVEFFLKQK